MFLSSPTLLKYCIGDLRQSGNPYHRDSPKTDLARSWLKKRIPEIAESNPLSNEYILPVDLITRIELREMYIKEMGFDEGEALCESSFNELLKVNHQSMSKTFLNQSQKSRSPTGPATETP